MEVTTRWSLGVFSCDVALWLVLVSERSAEIHPMAYLSQRDKGRIPVVWASNLTIWKLDNAAVVPPTCELLCPLGLHLGEKLRRSY